MSEEGWNRKGKTAKNTNPGSEHNAQQTFIFRFYQSGSEP
jgi:hypothetical protein